MHLPEGRKSSKKDLKVSELAIGVYQLIEKELGVGNVRACF
jgi:hypothetical protein